MQGLNPPQREAVLHCDTPLLVLAGAGSGKTRVITEKIAHLVRSGRYPARHVAAITFTNKAAREMRERVGRLLRGDAGEGLTVSTFHSLGLRFLQVEHERAGLRRGFSIFDSDDQAGLVRDLLPRGSKPDAVEAIRQLVSRAKNEALSPEQAAAIATSGGERDAAEVYARYQQRLATFNAVDFDDLIMRPLQLLESDPALAAAWRERIRYLLVDECQDTNGAQYRLLRQLAGPRGAITCVGDDDQSIYAWRGARPENLDQLATDYPDLRVIKLEQNYRCSRRILSAANTLIANNPHLHHKSLWSELDEGAPIRVWACRDSEHEAERVAGEIAFRHQAEEVPWRDFAILFRGNHQSRPLEKALQLLRVPYHLTGGTAFLERGEVKDAMAWLRVLANPDDDAAFLRAIAAPRREVGATSLAKLAEMARQAGLPLSKAAESTSLTRALTPRAAAGLGEFTAVMRRLRDAARKQPPAEVVRALVEQSGQLAALRAQCRDDASFQRRRGNLDELAAWFESAGDQAVGPGELAAQLSLLTHADRGEPGESVRLMSLHGSKGLEFRYVFIVGVEDGNLPHEASMEEGQLAEERRLMYVGITRARQGLWLSHSAEVKRWGSVNRLAPSRFLDELPAEVLHRDGADPERDETHRRDRTRAQFKSIAALFDD